MMAAGSHHITHCGLPGIEEIPYGLHACHFYRDRDELLATLVPYFSAGLRADERCLWVTAPPLPAREAIDALAGSWPDLERAISEGALSVVDSGHWYGNGSPLDGVDTIPLWLREEARALADGYRGLRITGNVSFLAPENHQAFMEYEHEISARFRGRHIVALCSYPAAQFSGRDHGDVVHAHHCAFEQGDNGWKVMMPMLMPDGT